MEKSYLELEVSKTSFSLKTFSMHTRGKLKRHPGHRDMVVFMCDSVFFPSAQQPSG